MKNKILFALIFSMIYFHGSSQTASVEKSTSGIQTGFLGVWIHNEVKLTNQIALRTEFGLSGYISTSDANSQIGYRFSPVLTAEPRWYYNLERRVTKSKSISGNSGDFLTLQTSYHPNWFSVSDKTSDGYNNFVTIIPTWGIRRTIGQHFNFETGLGLGYGRHFNSIQPKPDGVAYNLHIRIGYKF